MKHQMTTHAALQAAPTDTVQVTMTQAELEQFMASARFRQACQAEAAYRAQTSTLVQQARTLSRARRGPGYSAGELESNVQALSAMAPPVPMA